MWYEMQECICTFPSSLFQSSPEPYDSLPPALFPFFQRGPLPVTEAKRNDRTGLALIQQHLGSLWTKGEETGERIGCYDGVGIESRDDEERKTRDRGGQMDLNFR